MGCWRKGFVMDHGFYTHLPVSNLILFGDDKKKKSSNQKLANTCEMTWCSEATFWHAGIHISAVTLRA